MKCLLPFTSLAFLIAIIITAIYLSNHDAADSALHKAGYAGLNAFEYVAKELDKH
jgi:hypothetical protein